jgi:polysaccharide export outer membrane protein
MDSFMDSLKTFALLIFFSFSALNPVLAVDGETAAQEELLAAAKLDPYTVNPGDILLISVWKEDDLQGEVLVRPDGYFSFPLAGEVEATGKTVDEIRRDITEQLQRYIPDIVVTVSAQQIGGNKVYVIGQVNRPGDFLVNPRVDVMQALALAGGMTPFADVNDITILRRKGHVRMAIPFRYRDLERGKRLEQNVILQPGDVVVVP